MQMSFKAYKLLEGKHMLTSPSELQARHITKGTANVCCMQ